MDLLLGTDFQPYLGLLLVDASNVDKMVNLFTGQQSGVSDDGNGECLAPTPVCTQVPTEHSQERIVTVKLLQATRVPARHARLVRARVDGPSSPVPALVSLSKSVLRDGDLLIEEGVVEANKDGLITLVVHNRSPNAVLLEEGYKLGDLQATGLVSVGAIRESGDNVIELPSGEESLQEGAGDDDQRRAMLLERLDLNSQGLSGDERDRLTGLLDEFSDVFALSNSELGTTEVVAHQIDTGHHTPVRQPRGECRLSCAPRWRVLCKICLIKELCSLQVALGLALSFWCPRRTAG